MDSPRGDGLAAPAQHVVVIVDGAWAISRPSSRGSPSPARPLDDAALPSSRPPRRLGSIPSLRSFKSLATASTQLAGTLFTPPRTHQRLFEDVPFDSEKWEAHRNSLHRHRMEPLVFLRFAVGYVWQILQVELITVAVGLYHTYAVPAGAPPATQQLSTIFTILTFAVSLLLVFKTNSSYARWWEGRVIWGQVVNLSRNYARLFLQLAPPDKRHLSVAALRWAIAAPHVLRTYIRQEGPEAYLAAAHILKPSELAYLSTWRNVPSGAARAMSWLVSELHLHPQQQALLEEQVTLYIDMVGGCERIFKTPIPVAYTRHTSRFLMVFLSLSPILLWPEAGWATLAFMALIAVLLLGTENIGVQIEEPFRVLPLDAICAAIEASLRELELQYFGAAAGEGEGGLEGADEFCSEQLMSDMVLGPGAGAGAGQQADAEDRDGGGGGGSSGGGGGCSSGGA